jgi:hypothetical protein
VKYADDLVVTNPTMTGNPSDRTIYMQIRCGDAQTTEVRVRNITLDAFYYK